MPSFPEEKTYAGIPLGLQARRSVGKTKTYRVRNGVQEKMDYYTPKNPQTPTQQAWRAKFSTGVAQALALSEADRDVYRERAKGKPGQTWFTVYMAEYLWKESHCP